MYCDVACHSLESTGTGRYISPANMFQCHSWYVLEPVSIFLSLALMIIFSIIVFTESPASITRLAGKEALFHCAGYETGVPAEKLDLTWILNDRVLDSNSPRITQSTTPSSDTVQQTVQSNLTILATTENNGTTVKCRIGRISGGVPNISEESTLTVLGNSNIHSID